MGIEDTPVIGGLYSRLRAVDVSKLVNELFANEVEALLNGANLGDPQIVLPVAKKIAEQYKELVAQLLTTPHDKLSLQMKAAAEKLNKLRAAMGKLIANMDNQELANVKSTAIALGLGGEVKRQEEKNAAGQEARIQIGRVATFSELMQLVGQLGPVRKQFRAEIKDAIIRLAGLTEADIPPQLKLTVEGELRSALNADQRAIIYKQGDKFKVVIVERDGTSWKFSQPQALDPNIRYKVTGSDDPKLVTINISIGNDNNEVLTDIAVAYQQVINPAPPTRGDALEQQLTTLGYKDADLNGDGYLVRQEARRGNIPQRLFAALAGSEKPDAVVDAANVQGYLQFENDLVAVTLKTPAEVRQIVQTGNLMVVAYNLYQLKEARNKIAAEIVARAAATPITSDNLVKLVEDCGYSLESIKAARDYVKTLAAGAAVDAMVAATYVLKPVTDARIYGQVDQSQFANMQLDKEMIWQSLQLAGFIDAKGVIQPAVFAKDANQSIDPTEFANLTMPDSLSNDPLAAWKISRELEGAKAYRSGYFVQWAKLGARPALDWQFRNVRLESRSDYSSNDNAFRRFSKEIENMGQPGNPDEAFKIYYQVICDDYHLYNDTAALVALLEKYLEKKDYKHAFEVLSTLRGINPRGDNVIDKARKLIDDCIDSKKYENLLIARQALAFLPDDKSASKESKVWEAGSKISTYTDRINFLLNQFASRPEVYSAVLTIFEYRQEKSQNEARTDSQSEFPIKWFPRETAIYISDDKSLTEAIAKLKELAKTGDPIATFWLARAYRFKAEKIETEQGENKDPWNLERLKYNALAARYFRRAYDGMERGVKENPWYAQIMSQSANEIIDIVVNNDYAKNLVISPAVKGGVEPPIGPSTEKHQSSLRHKYRLVLLFFAELLPEHKVTIITNKMTTSYEKRAECLRHVMGFRQDENLLPQVKAEKDVFFPWEKAKKEDKREKGKPTPLPTSRPAPTTPATAPVRNTNAKESANKDGKPTGTPGRLPPVVVPAPKPTTPAPAQPPPGSRPRPGLPPPKRPTQPPTQPR